MACLLLTPSSHLQIFISLIIFVFVVFVIVSENHLLPVHVRRHLLPARLDTPAAPAWTQADNVWTDNPSWRGGGGGARAGGGGPPVTPLA